MPNPQSLTGFGELGPLHGNALLGLENVSPNFEMTRKPKKNPYTVFSSVVSDFAMIAIRDEVMQLAEDIVRELRRVIENQLLTWKPLSAAYLRRKRRLNLDERILIATGHYLDSIQVRTDPNDDWKITIGFYENQQHPVYEGIDFNDLARWLEYGTTQMAARPHWRPVFYKFRQEFNQTKKRLEKDLVNIVEGWLKDNNV